MVAPAMVYRHNAPAGLKGHICHVLRQGAVSLDRYGSRIHNCGDELIAIEFADGQRHVVARAAVVRADSKIGRQTVARVKRGDVQPATIRRRSRQ